MNYLIVLFFSLIGGLFSLAGGVFLITNKKAAKALTKVATPFAAGALLSAVFIEHIPESLETGSPRSSSAWILVGLCAFFILEYFFHYFHHHDDHAKAATPIPLLMIGDTLHNLLDGFAIGAAFLVDHTTGVVTTIAIAAHEIPQEIGDFGLMLHFGYSKKLTLDINALSALAATAGAIIIYALGTKFTLPVNVLLALIAGMFIYISASDLMPLIQQDAKKRQSSLPLVLFLCGIIAIAVTTTIVHHIFGEV